MFTRRYEMLQNDAGISVDRTRMPHPIVLIPLEDLMIPDLSRATEHHRRQENSQQLRHISSLRLEDAAIVVDGGFAPLAVA